MGYTVKVEHPHFPEGYIFNVGGLDRVPNGGSLDVDEEMERLFIMQNGQTVEDAFANDAIMNVSGSSALDKDEVDAMLEAYGPQPEEETPEQPAWMNSATTVNTAGLAEDEGGEVDA